MIAEIWPPSRCLHSPDTREDEERKKERQRIAYSCSAPTQSPPKLRASGHGDSMLWLTSGAREDCVRGVCVYCVWMSEVQIRETYITCLRFAVFAWLLFQSSQTEHSQALNVFETSEWIKDVVHFCPYVSVSGLQWQSWKRIVCREPSKEQLSESPRAWHR